MKPIEITDLSDPRLAVYAQLTERRLRNKRDPSNAVFIVESPKVIKVALAAGCQPVSLLCERRHIGGDAADIVHACEDVPIYTGSLDILSKLTGYTLTRGVLCAMRRPPEHSLSDIIAAPGRRRIAVLDSVVDNTNIGSIFRSAAALGIDAVILTRTCCDPLNRRSVRVSMGSVFLVPWAWAKKADEVHSFGYKTVALALTDRSIPIDDPHMAAEERLAFVLGSEGWGLSDDVISSCDYTARIPMHNGVDSLNVATAAAIAFWQMR